MARAAGSFRALLGHGWYLIEDSGSETEAWQADVGANRQQARQKNRQAGTDTRRAITEMQAALPTT
jgi:hypothetical protein